MKPTSILLAAALCTLVMSSALAQVPTERVLVPVLWEGIGHGGALWRAELLISNTGTSPAIVAAGSPECPFERCDKSLGAGEVWRYPDAATGSNPSVYFVVDRPHSDDVHFFLRVWDSSVAGMNFGTSIPVVREAEWLKGKAELLHLPMDDAFRVSLRCYERQPSDTLSLRVTIRSENGDDVLAEKTLVLLGGDVSSTYPLVSSYAAIMNLVDEFPDLSTRGYVRVRFEPSEPREYWVFASVTNNFTNAVTTVTPE